VPTAHEIREDVPEGVSEVIAKMMAKEPAERYQTAGDVVAALLPFAEDTPFLSATPSGRLVPITVRTEDDTNAPPRPKRKKRLVIALLTAIIVLIAAIATGLLL